MTCIGSTALSRGRPDKPNDSADEGTAFHFLASECLTKNEDAHSFLGRDICVYSDNTVGFRPANKSSIKPRFVAPVTGGDYNHIQSYLNYVRTAAHLSELFVEVEVPIDHLTDEDRAKGTADAIIINSAQKELHVIDLKYGQGVEVSAENNYQMMMYALGALKKFEEQTAGVTNIRMTIFQPRSGDGKPKEWSCSRADLEKFGERVKRAATDVWAALELYDEMIAGGVDPASEMFQQWVDSYLITSEKGCQWCRAKAICPKLGSEVANITFAEFGNVEQDTLPVEIVEIAGKHPNQDLANKMLKVPLIEGWLKAVRAEVESELVKGNEVPHFKLVMGRKGDRKWSSEEAAVQLLKKFRFKNDDIYKMTLLTPTKIIEEVIPKDKKEWVQKVQELIVQEDGKPSVAHESDKRDAISLKPTTDGMEAVDDDFDDLMGDGAPAAKSTPKSTAADYEDLM